MWTYEQPVTITFGAGTVKEIVPLARKQGWKRGIIVSTPHFVKNGFVDRLLQQGAGLITDVFSNITPNPEVNDVDDCAAVMRNWKNDFVIAIGGGSAMDLAKAAASVCQTNDSIRDYHGTGKTLPAAHLPLIAVPTTAGTGSEVTSVAVLSDKDRHKKGPIVSQNFFPDYAVVDPELTYEMPPYLTACCGRHAVASTSCPMRWKGIGVSIISQSVMLALSTRRPWYSSTCRRPAVNQMIGKHGKNSAKLRSSPGCPLPCPRRQRRMPAAFP